MGNFLLVMKSLYSNLKSYIKTSKGLTDYFHCTLGTRQGHNTLFLSSPHLRFIIVFICDLFVSRDDPLIG